MKRWASLAFAITWTIGIAGFIAAVIVSARP